MEFLLKGIHLRGEGVILKVLGEMGQNSSLPQGEDLGRYTRYVGGFNDACRISKNG